LFEAEELAVLSRFWFAELDPLSCGAPTFTAPTETPLPLTVTGTFALTPF
jgi:hypothetical protein